MKSEKKVQDEIFEEFGAVPYMRIWRVNVGMGFSFWQVKALVTAIKKKNFVGALQICANLVPIRYGTPGQSDIMGILKKDGRLIGIEVKRENGVQGEEQVKWEKMIVSMNGIYILAKSIDDVKSRLQEQGYL